MKFLEFLQSRMTTPTAYGWYHLMCIGIMIALSVGLSFVFKNASDKKIRLFLLITSIVMILLEVLKQFVFSYDIENNKIVWDYQWYAFPFQFCSTPMYIAFIASVIKKDKVQDCLYSFLATYGLFAGALVLFCPGDVFMSYIAINIQTMFHHGMMAVIGVVLLTSKSVKIEHKTILKAGIVFISLIAIALLMNCIYVWVGGNEKFNMFYISPYKECNLIVFSTIQANVPYIVFLLSYVVGFSIAAYIILLIAILIKFIISKIRSANKIKA